MSVSRVTARLALTMAACSAPARPTTPSAGDSAHAAHVLASWQQHMHAGDVEGVLAMLTDDAYVIGVGGCKGEPCIGKQQIRDNYIGPVLSAGFKLQPFEITRVEGDRVYALSRVRSAISPRGASLLHVKMQFVLRGDHVARLLVHYDLSDPETILIRYHNGELSFALRETGKDAHVIGAILLSIAPDIPNAITLFVDDALGAREPLNAQLRHGTCDSPGAVAHELTRVSDGRSDTLLPTHRDDLLDTPHHVVVRAQDGRVLACTDIPQSKDRIGGPTGKGFDWPVEPEAASPCPPGTSR
jgi:ketosteroid isomerase-like protein